MKNILISGASGFVGRKLYTQFSNVPDCKISGTYLTKEKQPLIQLDCTDFNRAEYVFRQIRPDIVIHAAGMSRSAQFRTDPEGAHKINVIGAHNIATLCEKYGAQLVFLSTTHVFPQARSEPYKENYQIGLSYDSYGASKAASEEVVRQLAPKSIIIRSDLLVAYNPDGNSHLLGQVLEGKATINTDKPRQPLLVSELAYNILRLTTVGFSGTIHIAGRQVMLYSEFLTELSSIAGVKLDIPKDIPSQDGILLDTAQARGLEMKMGDIHEIRNCLENELGAQIGEGHRRLP